MSALPDPEWHPAASIFPMMSDERLRALADDIKAHGLRDPIVLLGGEILDGRNRWRACQLAGVEPKCDYANTLEIGDPYDYVASKNYHRRDLTESQRAMAGAKLREHYAARAKDRQSAAGGDRKSKTAKRKKSGSLVQNSAQAIDPSRARDEAAKAVNVSHFSVDAATKVTEDGVPELAAAVLDGKVSVSAAAEVAAFPAEQQSAIVAEGPKAVVAAAKAKREERKAKAKPRVKVTTAVVAEEPWDLNRTLGELNSALLDVEQQCPATDLPLVAAFLDRWTRKFQEDSHVRAIA
jgi:hypothetical protein